MKKYLLFFALCFVSAISHAEIYKWIDKDGIAHFSDLPQPGATTVTLPGYSTKDPAKTAGNEPSKAKNSKPAAVASEPEKHVYKNLAISYPKEGTSIFDNNGTVPINIDLDPGLLEGDKVQIELDGAPFGEPKTSGTLQITGVNRGSHTLTVVVKDKDDKPLITSSPAVTFFLKKAIVRQ